MVRCFLGLVGCDVVLVWEEGLRDFGDDVDVGTVVRMGREVGTARWVVPARFRLKELPMVGLVFGLGGTLLLLLLLLLLCSSLVVPFAALVRFEERASSRRASPSECMS